MQENTVVPFFARQAADRGLSIKTGVKAGAREQTVKLVERREK